jgi:hypothetical protein
MRLLFSTLFLAMVSVASADMLPVLNWSGAGNVTGGFYLFPANANVTPNGLSASDSWVGIVGSGVFGYIPDNYDATTAFTVTSAGDFQLSGMGGFSLGASTCTDVGCSQIGANFLPLQIDLTTTVSILDSLGNTVATESFSGSASSSYGSCQLFPEFNLEDCFANAELNASIPSGVFDLSTGNYTLDVDVSSVAYEVYGNATGGYSQLEGDVIPIPTPEPREWWMLLALSVLMCVAKLGVSWKRHRRFKLLDSRPNGVTVIVV